MKVYVAGPYTAETKLEIVQNTLKAIDAGLKLYKKGHQPYVPHLTHWMDSYAKKAGIEMTWQDYMDYHMPWIESCDAILILGSSPGANRELAKAVALGMPVYYSVDDVPSVDVAEQLGFEFEEESL